MITIVIHFTGAGMTMPRGSFFRKRYGRYQNTGIEYLCFKDI